MLCADYCYTTTRSSLLHNQLTRPVDLHCFRQEQLNTCCTGRIQVDTLHSPTPSCVFNTKSRTALYRVQSTIKPQIDLSQKRWVYNGVEEARGKFSKRRRTEGPFSAPESGGQPLTLPHGLYCFIRRARQNLCKMLMSPKFLLNRGFCLFPREWRANWQNSKWQKAGMSET